MKILLALGNKLLSSALMDSLTNCHCSHNGNVRVLVPTVDCTAGDFKNSDVILVDYFTLARIPEECFEHAKVMVVDNGMDKETIASLFITGNIKGIVDAHADITVLCKAIRVVHEGQLWIDNATIRMLLSQNISRKAVSSGRLTDREMSIVNLVRQGHKNKDVASTLCISEQTVKTHLNRIFRKLDVKNRTEMIGKIADLQSPESPASSG